MTEVQERALPSTLEARIEVLEEQREDFIDLVNKLMDSNDQLRTENQRLRETIAIYRETVELVRPTFFATRIVLDAFDALEKWDNARG